MKRVQEAFDRGGFEDVLNLTGGRPVFHGPDPKYYPMLIFRGLAAKELKQFKVAEDAFTEASELKPDLPKAWKGLADVYEASEQHKKALKPLEELRKIAVSKGNVGRAAAIALSIAKIHEKLQDSPTAIKILNDVIETNEVPATALGPVLTKLIQLEEKKIRLSPEKKVGLADVYDRLLVAYEASSRSTGEGEGGGGDEGEEKGDEQWKEQSEGILALYPKVRLQMIAGAAASEKGKSWEKAWDVCQKVLSLGITAERVVTLEGALQCLWYFSGAASEVSTEEVAGWVKEVLSANPSSAVGLLFVGMRYYTELKLSEAITYIRKALNVSPSSSLAFSYLLDAYAAGNYSTVDPSNVVGYFSKSQEVFQADEQKLGLPVCKDIWIDRDIALARLKKRLGLMGEARDLLLEVIQKDPLRVSALVDLGDVEIEMGLIDEGEKRYDAAMEIDASNDRALAGSGWVKHLKKEDEEARKRLEAAVSMNARNAYYLGRYYWDMGGEFRSGKEYCVAMLLKAAQLLPLPDGPFLYLGRFYLEVVGDKERAKKCFLKSVGLEPLNEQAGEQASRLCLESGEEMEVLKMWEDVTRKSARALWAWKWMGRWHSSKGEYEEAVTCLQYALRVKEEDCECWSYLGKAYHALERHAPAIKAFLKAEELEPENAEVKFRLGLVQKEVGEVEEGAQRLKDAAEKTGWKDLLVLKGLIDTMMSLAYKELGLGFHGKASLAILDGIHAAKKFLEVAGDAYLSVWKLLGDLYTLTFLLPDGVFEGKVGGSSTLDMVKEGETAYTRILQLEPNHEVSSCYDLGFNLFAQIRLIRLQGGEGCGAGEKEKVMMEVEGLRQKGWEAFKKAVALDPCYSPAWLGLGVIDKRPLIKQHCLIRAIELEHHPSAWANLGMLFGEEERPDLAREAFRSLQAVQDHPMMWVGVGILEEVEANYNPSDGYSIAIDAYSAGLEIGAHPEALIGLASVCYKAKRIRDSQSSIIQYTSLRTFNANAYNLAGVCLHDLGKSEFALDYLNRGWDLVNKEGVDGSLRAILAQNLLRAEGETGEVEKRAEVWNALPRPVQKSLLEAKAFFVKGDLARVVDILEKASSLELGEREACYVNLLKYVTKIQEKNYGAAETEVENVIAQAQTLGRDALLRLRAAAGVSGQQDLLEWTRSKLVGFSGMPSARDLLQGYYVSSLSASSPAPSRSFCKALILYPSDPSVWVALGQSRAVAGDLELGRFCAKTATEVGCQAGVEKALASRWLEGFLAPPRIVLPKGSEDDGQNKSPRHCRGILHSLHANPSDRHLWQVLGSTLTSQAIASQDPEDSMAACKVISNPAVTQGRASQIVDSVRGAFDVIDGKAGGDLARARINVKEGRLQEAITIYKQVLKEKRRPEEMIAVWWELGELYLQIKKYEAGVYCLESAANLQGIDDDIRASLFVRLAGHFYALGDGEKGMEHVGQACKINKDLAAGVLLRGLLWRLEEGVKREKLAQENFQRAKELRPTWAVLQTYVS